MPTSDASLSPPGKAAILVPLILGGAVVVSLILFWDAHARKARLAEMTDNEIAARTELRSAGRALRSADPAAALERTDAAGASIRKLRPLLAGSPHADYAELRISRLLLEAEALFMQDAAANAAVAEEKFGEALSLMVFSSGELWQTAHLGRGRARYEQGRYAEAVSDFDQVLTRNANYGAAYAWRSLARERAGDAEGARGDARTAKRLDSWPPLRAFARVSGEIR